MRAYAGDMRNILLFSGICGIVGTLLGNILCARRYERLLTQINDRIENRDAYLYLLEQWCIKKSDGYKLSDSILFKGKKSYALYGWNEAARCAIKELKDKVDLKYIIDRNAANLKEEDTPSPIVQLEDANLDEVDIIIVTAYLSFDNIRKEIQKRGNIDIVSIEQLVFGLEE